MSADAADALEESRAEGDPRAIEEALRSAARAEPADAASLVRLHDALLFHRAHPRSHAAVALAERALRRVPRLVAALAREGADLAPFDDLHAAGVAGTAVSMPFPWGAIRWLAGRFPRALSIDWDVQDDVSGLERVLPRLFPLVAEEARADVGVDWRAWVDAARPRGAREVPWLVSRIDALAENEETKALLWEALRFQVSWRLPRGASRTFARRRFAPWVFRAPFVKRSETSLAAEMERLPRPRRLSARDGERALDLCRSAVLCRYRDLYSFTRGDGRAVWEAELGHGASVLLCGVARGDRLPLRAGFGHLLLRNGVPVGYGDAFALGPRLDFSFNVFYAFRDGESALLLARLLAAYRALLRVRVFRADPYQVGGNGNEEGVASGAFFFYRRLGFRSADPALDALAERAEARGRRTPPATLRRLGGAAVLWSEDPGERARWGRFSVLALATRAMRGDRAARTLVQRLAREKEGLDEARYARALAEDARFGAALLRAGSPQPARRRSAASPSRS